MELFFLTYFILDIHYLVPKIAGIQANMVRLRSSFTLVDNEHPQRRRTVHSDDGIAAAEHSIEEDPHACR